MIREWLWEPKGNSLEYMFHRRFINKEHKSTHALGDDPRVWGATLSAVVGCEIP